MPETGLVVVANGPIESVYKLAPNGLFLPPHVTPTPALWLMGNPYPEFAQALIKELDCTFFYKPSSNNNAFKVPTFNIPKPKEPTLVDIAPGFQGRVSGCPARKCTGGPVFGLTVQGMIIHLNDDHHWSRERIANYLDTLTDIDMRVKKVTYAQN